MASTVDQSRQSLASFMTAPVLVLEQFAKPPQDRHLLSTTSFFLYPRRRCAVTLSSSLALLLSISHALVASTTFITSPLTPVIPLE
jgi:hypothetical protein